MVESEQKCKKRLSRKTSERRLSVIALGIVMAIAISAGYSWCQTAVTGGSFVPPASAETDIRSRIQTIPSRGQRHLSPGQPYTYPDQFPTSGTHDPDWVKPGFYVRPQPPTKLVHSLEHGNIVIYYDNPGDEALNTLKSWASLYSGQWDGVIVTPMQGMGRTVVLTAWTKKLTLERFDSSTAAAFVDLFRGRGPENPMR